MGGTAGVADSQTLPVSLGEVLRWCQLQAFVSSLLIWFQVSFPQLLSQVIPEETGTFPPCPWVSNRRSAENGLHILARSKALLSPILMALLWVILKFL